MQKLGNNHLKIHGNRKKKILFKNIMVFLLIALFGYAILMISRWRGCFSLLTAFHFAHLTPTTMNVERLTGCILLHYSKARLVCSCKRWFFRPIKSRKKDAFCDKSHIYFMGIYSKVSLFSGFSRYLKRSLLFPVF
jgi:hypothetical protein